MPDKIKRTSINIDVEVKQALDDIKFSKCHGSINNTLRAMLDLGDSREYCGHYQPRRKRYPDWSAMQAYSGVLVPYQDADMDVLPSIVGAKISSSSEVIKWRRSVESYKGKNPIDGSMMWILSYNEGVLICKLPAGVSPAVAQRGVVCGSLAEHIASGRLAYMAEPVPIEGMVDVVDIAGNPVANDGAAGELPF